jgi:hypothetical protein
MPLFYGKCSNCGSRKKFLTDEGDWDSISESKLRCSCSGKYIRDARGPFSSVKEILDNGAMPRAVERFEDIEELKRDRLSKADSNAGRKNRS